MSAWRTSPDIEDTFAAVPAGFSDLVSSTVTVSPLCLSSLVSTHTQLPGGRRDEPGPQRPADQRPHDGRVGSGQAQALHLPAARPSQPAEQEGAASADDAAGTGQPLVLARLKCGAEPPQDLRLVLLLEHTELLQSMFTPFAAGLRTEGFGKKVKKQKTKQQKKNKSTSPSFLSFTFIVRPPPERVKHRGRK